ncbi:MAG: hypothetical protein ACKOCE_02155 [Acidimicrobiia bacterium]
MDMQHRHVPSLTLALFAALGLIATSCGDDPDASGPPVLVVSGSGGVPNASAEMAAGASESKMWATYQMRFVAGADLPALDSDAKSYSLSAGSYSADDVTAIASVFGVSGDVVELGADVGGGYRIGSEDGSTDSLWASGDASGYWYFSPKYDESMMSRGCAIGASPDGTVSSEPVECVTPEPPANVPSEDEARSLFATMVSDMGLDADDMVLETYADEWSASVYGYLLIDGVRSPLTVSIGFGAEGAVTWASGFLGDIVSGAEYPRIGTTAGLERLNDQVARPYPLVRGDVGLAIDDVAVSEMAVSEVVPSADVPVPTEPVADGTTVGVTATDVPVELEVQEVTIVAVEEELVMLYGQDGSIYLVPGYSFIAAEDEYGYTPRYTVSALPDEYVQQAEPIAVEPGVIEPAIDPAVDPSGAVIADVDAAALVGSSEAEATEAAKSKGWDVRVVSRDGEDFPVTADYRGDRVNLTIVDDVVTASTVG